MTFDTAYAKEQTGNAEIFIRRVRVILHSLPSNKCNIHTHKGTRAVSQFIECKS